MEEILKLAALGEPDGPCPYCGEDYHEQGVCVICDGCVFCCWAGVHCLWCDLPELLCGCQHCDADT